jgi:hypothetical protein
MPPPRRASRVATSREAASPPPAEPPATAIELALRPWPVRSRRHAAKTSSMAAGRDARGQTVLREQHPHPAGPSQPGARSPSLRTDASSKPPPCRNSNTRPASVAGAARQWARTPPAVTSLTATHQGPDEGSPRERRRHGALPASAGPGHTGLPSVPQAIDQILYGLARLVASAQAASLIRPPCHFISTDNRPGRRRCERGDREGLESLAD